MDGAGLSGQDGRPPGRCTATLRRKAGLRTGLGRARCYLSVMADNIRILYNDTCPLCSWEVGHYRRAAGEAGGGAGGVAFDSLDRAADWGMTEDQAARALHVRRDGQVLQGLEAFRAVWAALPGWRWLARLTGLPVVRPVIGFVYDRVAAPVLYRAHLRRQARRKA
ncbi:MAG: thiol-disulfide oxidoreductase DCC family protein [Gemmobacter sp.]